MFFGLPLTPKCKFERQGYEAAMREFGRYLRLVRDLRSPALVLERALLGSLDVARGAGRAYKDSEGRLDALFRAYLAALVPGGRLEMLGTPEEGGIVVPRESVPLEPQLLATRLGSRPAR